MHTSSGAPPQSHDLRAGTRLAQPAPHCSGKGALRFSSVCVQEADKVRYEQRRAGMAVLEEQLQEREEQRRLAEEQRHQVRLPPGRNTRTQHSHIAHTRQPWPLLRGIRCLW